MSSDMLIKSKSLDTYFIFYLSGKTFVSPNYILFDSRKGAPDFGLVS